MTSSWIKRVALGALVGAALMARTGSVRAQTPTSSPPTRGVVVVLADVQARAEPDMATFHAGVEASAATPREALSSTTDQMQTVLGILRQLGVADADIQTSGLSMHSVYASSSPGDNAPAQVTGYRASNGATVTVRDLKQLSPTLDALSGARISDLGGLELGVRDTAALHAQVITDAVLQARPLGEAAAQAAGLVLGPIQSIEEVTGGTPSVDFSSRGGAGATPPVRGGMLTVHVQLQVAFAITAP